MNRLVIRVTTLCAFSAILLSTSLVAEAVAGLLITPTAGYSITSNGNDGDYFDPTTPATAPDNLASRSGVTAFGTSAYPSSSHTIAHANDGLYGNINSWLAHFSSDPTPHIGLDLGGGTVVSGIAWSRDNGNNDTETGNAPSGSGQYNDRSIGTYTLQYTRMATPGSVTVENADPTLGWATIGTVNYQSDDDIVVGGAFTSYFRHEYGLAQNGQPLTATGVRIKPSNSGTCIDEIELYTPVPVEGLAAWLNADVGVETTGTAVTAWRDLSGNDNDAMPTGTTAPTLTGTMAGQTVVHFNGTDQRLDLPSASTLGLVNSDYEMFMVAQSGSTATQFLVSGGVDQYGEMHLNGDAGARFIPNAPWNTQAVDIGTPGQYSNGSPHIFNPRVDGTAGYLCVDGRQSLDTATNAQIPGDGIISLGIRSQNGDYPFNGDMGEVLIYNRALTPTERGEVEFYLSSKWGVAVRELTLAETGGTFGVRNVAAASAGGVAFAKDLIANGGYTAHQIDHLNDETYGNPNSWIGATDPSFAGVAFDGAQMIHAIAFGRSNTGAHTDRYQGTYTLQYTLVDDPDATTPDSLWATISDVTYTSTQPDSTGWLRHLYNFDPILDVTGIRILVDSTLTNIAIDEIEAYAVPEPAGLMLVLLGALGLAMAASRNIRRHSR